jgi:hypothetical protein
MDGRSNERKGTGPLPPEAGALPHVDEHAVGIGTGTAVVWQALSDELDRALSRPVFAHYVTLVGAAERAPSGPRPPVAGAQYTGFRVVAAVPGRELFLLGRHRFSDYALLFRVGADGPGRSRLRAETRARFPGPAGGLYRTLVIGSGGHAVVVRHLLSAVRRRSERVAGAARAG